MFKNVRVSLNDFLKIYTIFEGRIQDKDIETETDQIQQSTCLVNTTYIQAYEPKIVGSI